jgi:D-alanine-D-alanine ligase
LGQDKCKILHQMQDLGFHVPEWEKYTSTDNVAWEKFPAIVKPAFEHCSYGITRDSVVQTPVELIHRIQFVLDKFQQPALVEEFIDGREFHVGVIGNGHPFMLPPAEVDFSGFCDIHDRLCTYEAKFEKTSLAYQLTALKLPVDLSTDQLRLLEEMVIIAYQATGCRDYARMDIRLQDDIFYILDVNHNADLAPETSMILGAERVGLSYGQFGSLLVNLAARRHAIFGG